MRIGFAARGPQINLLLSNPFVGGNHLFSGFNTVSGHSGRTAHFKPDWKSSRHPRPPISLKLCSSQNKQIKTGCWNCTETAEEIPLCHIVSHPSHSSLQVCDRCFWTWAAFTFANVYFLLWPLKSRRSSVLLNADVYVLTLTITDLPFSTNRMRLKLTDVKSKCIDIESQPK